MSADAMIHGLPGAALVHEGVRDVLDARLTIPALVVSIGRERLVQARLLPEAAPVISTEPERELYRLLRAEDGDAYSRYNALIRELVSFFSALAARSRRGAAARAGDSGRT
jgi:hypothetical protein